MKDRVEGFLKVARERIKEDNENIEKFNDLCGSLTSLIKDEELKDYVFTEYEKIVDEVKLQEWDERFLNVIANNYEEKESAFYGKALVTTGKTNALWANTAPPNTMLTSATMAKAAQDILKAQLEAQFKDEYAKYQTKNRYKTP